MLTYFHTDDPLETDFAGLTRLATAFEINDARLHWWDWTRYSSRQATEMQMGGLLGEIRMTSSELEALWPYLWLGQFTHTGSGTIMGLGKYEIAAGSSPFSSGGGQEANGCAR